jgi:hypothetical protein
MRHLIDILAVACGGLGLTTIALGWAWIVARGRAIRAESILEGIRLGQSPQAHALTHTVESMALEIERIGESQRFLTKVLADRTERTHPRQIGQTTPH